MVGGEASSSRPKRLRLTSEAEAASGTLFELKLFDCPICYNPLTSPIFQCDNGHVLCSPCCTRSSNKCPTCTMPTATGKYRCRAVESIVEAIIVPCPNAKYGCTRKFSYGKELVHEKTCEFGLCYCPDPKCSYAGVYKDVFSHYRAKHIHPCFSFLCDVTRRAWLLMSEKIVLLQEFFEGELIAIQCFSGREGVYVSVKSIAPCAPGVGRFSFKLSYTIGGRTVGLESKEMARIQRVSYETPEKDYMLVPYYFFDQGPVKVVMLKMNIYIHRLEEEKAAEEEEE